MRYKYEVRRLYRQQQHIKCELMASALSQSRSREFWNEVHKISNSAKGRKTAAPVIDNQSSDKDISNLFCINLKTVLNSANDLSNRSELLTTVSDSLSAADLNAASITPNIVSEASSHLKVGKSDGTPLCSNHFICASAVLCEPLSKLFYSHFKAWVYSLLS